MAFEKIENADLSGKMISELADVPELTADELKKRFDAASKDVIIPKFNKLIDALAALSAASNIGMNPPEGITAEQNIAAVITALAVSVKSNSDSSHSHNNKAVIDAITADAKKKYDDLVLLFSAIKTISNVVKDDSTLLPTGKAIVDYVKELGGGDMLKATYDSDNDGVVDNASKLGGQAPAYYQKSTDNTLQTDNKTVAGAINEVYGMAQNGGKNLIGEDFSSEKSYTVGKHVINGNSRYRFIVDHPAGPWDASHVEEIPVDKEMEDLTEKTDWTKVSFVGSSNSIDEAISNKKCANVPNTAKEITVDITVKRNSDTTIKFSQSIKTYGEYCGGYYNSEKYYASYQIVYRRDIIMLYKSWLKVVDNGTAYDNSNTVQVDVYYR